MKPGDGFGLNCRKASGLGVAEMGMNLLSAHFEDRLFSWPNEIAFLDHLAEFIRKYLDARYASAQLFNPALKNLHLVAYREFTKTLIDQFDDVPITSGTTCARAAHYRVPILVPDVTTDAEWTPYLNFSEEAGFGGLLSLALLSRTGELLGVTSCHFEGLAKPSEIALNFASVSCTFASDAIVELRRRRAFARTTRRAGSPSFSTCYLFWSSVG
jgi:hypothetical protein